MADPAPGAPAAPSPANGAAPTPSAPTALSGGPATASQAAVPNQPQQRTFLNPSLNSADKSLFPNSLPVRQTLPAIHSFASANGGGSASPAQQQQQQQGAAYGAQQRAQPQTKPYAATSPYGTLPSFSTPTPTPTPPIIPPAGGNAKKAASPPAPSAASPSLPPSRPPLPGHTSSNTSAHSHAASPSAPSPTVQQGGRNPMSVSSMLSGPPRNAGVAAYPPHGAAGQSGASPAPSVPAPTPQPPVLPPENKPAAAAGGTASPAQQRSTDASAAPTLPGFVQGGTKPATAPPGTTPAAALSAEPKPAAPTHQHSHQPSHVHQHQQQQQAQQQQQQQQSRSSYPPLPSAFARENPYSPSPSATSATASPAGTPSSTVPPASGIAKPASSAATAQQQQQAASAAAAAQIKNSFFPSLGSYRPGSIGRTTSTPASAAITGGVPPQQQQQQGQQQQQQPAYPWQQAHLGGYGGLASSTGAGGATGGKTNGPPDPKGHQHSHAPHAHHGHSHGRSASQQQQQQQAAPRLSAAPASAHPTPPKSLSGGAQKSAAAGQAPVGAGGVGQQRFSSLFSEGFGGRNGGLGLGVGQQQQQQAQAAQRNGAGGVKRRRSDAAEAQQQQQQQHAHAAHQHAHQQHQHSHPHAHASHAHHHHHHHHHLQSSVAGTASSAAGTSAALAPIPSARVVKNASTSSVRGTPPPAPSTPTPAPPPPPPPFTHAEARKAAVVPPLVDVRNEAVERVMASLAREKGEGKEGKEERPFLGRVVYDPLVEPAELLDGERMRRGVGGRVEVVMPVSWILGPSSSSSSFAKGEKGKKEDEGEKEKAFNLASVRLSCSNPPSHPPSSSASSSAPPVSLSFGPPISYTGSPLPLTSPSTPLSLPPHLLDLPAFRRRKVWGTDVYTDDSDVLGVLVHSGWVRVAVRGGKEGEGDGKGMGEKRWKAGEKGAGEDALRRALLPGSPPPAPAAEREEGKKASEEEDKVPKALLVTLGVVPPLVRYQGLERQGVRSRSWGNGHDGVSLRVESVVGVEDIPPPSALRSRKPSVSAYAASLAQQRHDCPHFSSSSSTSSSHSSSFSSSSYPTSQAEIEPAPKRYRFSVPVASKRAAEKMDEDGVAGEGDEEEVVDVTDTFVLDWRAGEEGKFVDLVIVEEEEGEEAGDGMKVE